MDFFQSSYYRINERFLYYLGQWPLQTPSERHLYTSVTMFLIGSLLVPQCLGNLDAMIQCLPPLAVQARCFTRFLNCRINATKMNMLTNRIKDDWDRRSANLERTILTRYAKLGKRMSIIYIGFVYLTLVLYDLLRILPVILDVVSPLNRSRDRIFIYETEYFVDVDKNYAYITLHACFTMPFVVAVVVANESMFGVYVIHACGIFATLGARLESLGGVDFANEKSDTKKHLIKRDGETYDKIVDCIKIHKEALGKTYMGYAPSIIVFMVFRLRRYAELIESSCCVSQVFIIGVNTVVITVVGYMVVAHSDRPAESFTWVGFGIAVIIGLFHPCWLGHTLMEHSQNIFLNAYNVDWSDMTSRERKLLIMIMMRSAEPCKLTAGKIFVWSMENFGMALKTSMSYFTVLLSIQ